MMIAEGCVAGELDSPFCEIVEKGGWIADATKREILLLACWLSIFSVCGLAVCFHAEQFGASVKDGRGSVTLNDRFGGGRMLAARDDDNIGAAQRGNWFAKTSSRKKMASAEGIGRVKQNNVDIARELEMLKTVVENKTFDTATCQFPALRETICTNADFDLISEPIVEESRFVIPALRNFDASDGAGAFRQRTIAARQYGSFVFAGCKTLREPDGHGSFTRAANGEIADADDDAAQTALMDNSCAVSPRA